MDKENYKTTFTEDDSPGWSSIDSALEKIYGTQKPLIHYAPKLPPVIGGQGPDGVSLYLADGYLHFISYGFSELHYNEESAGKEFSKWGFELTFRLKIDTPVTQETAPRWPISVMQNLYNYVNKSQRWFEPMQAIPVTDRPINLDVNLSESVITGLGFVEDPKLKSIDTPHGRVQFIQMIGLTQSEAQHIKADATQTSIIIRKLGIENPLYITDMKRGL
ncbi:MAG: suppressor of fused domain protein [Alphaproteobacteria bacterium]|nr:suppressor of fused domain protein [Alphaproteobacteria bacterium]